MSDVKLKTIEDGVESKKNERSCVQVALQEDLSGSIR